MLFNNVKPLIKKRASQTTESGTDYAVLRALAGLHCSVCDAPLSSEDRQSSGSQPQPHSAYTCCQQAHCPYCGATPKEKCAHLFAARTSGDWRIAGLPEVADKTLPEPPFVSAKHLLDYSEAQKQVAWGAAYPLLIAQYGPGWRSLLKDSISGSDLVRDIARPENRQDIGSNQYYFTTDTEKCAARIRQALTQDIAAGFDRMTRESPDGSEFVQRIIALEVPPRVDSQINAVLHMSIDSQINAVAFSPCSNYFSVLRFRRGELWETSAPDTAAPILFRISRSPDNSFVKYCAVKFSADGHFLSARCAVNTVDKSLEGNFIEIRDAQTGDLLQTLPERGDIGFETGNFVEEEGQMLDGFLHGGATYLTVRGRCIRLYGLSSDSSSEEPVLTLTLRMPISHLATAPDGETFITTAESFAIVWRVPAAELPQ